jgi:PTS system nitrogen regulatory IIA component
MDIVNLIAPAQVLADLKVADKPQVLREIGRRAAAALGLDARNVVDALTAREGMGSTGIGQGIAVPHARLPGLTQSFGLFARLARPVDFAAIDGKPVDLVFLLLTPAVGSGDHLAALACVARRLRDPAVAGVLRGGGDAKALFQSLTGLPQAERRLG